MNVVLALYRDIKFDSRPKRALHYLSSFAKVTLVHKGSNDLKLDAESIISISNPIDFAINVLKTAKAQDNKAIYAVGLLSLLFCIPAKLITNRTLIYDSRELYLKDDVGNSTYSWKHRLIERIIIRFADAVVCANFERMNFMKNFYRTPKYYSYLHNIPLFKFTPEEKVQNLRKKIVYQGHIGLKRGLEKFINTLSLLKTDFEVIFVVPEDQHLKLSEALKEFNFIWSILPFMPLSELYRFLSTCDLGYVAYELHGPNNFFCEPNKLYEYANVHLKIISSPQPMFNKVFSEYGIGVCLDIEAWTNNDYSHMAQQVDSFLQANVPDSSFHAFNTVYSFDSEMLRFKEFFTKLAIS